jgi:hypothetical protein
LSSLLDRSFFVAQDKDRVMILEFITLLAALLAQPPTPSPTSAAALDFAAFRDRVQPILLAKRPGHARCVTCHSAGTAFRLQPLLPGSTTWNEEQSRKNFEAIRRVVAPGNLKSRLLMHPLAEQAGGDFFHNGGKHWKSQNDPEWQAMKAWVLGETRSGRDR